MINKELHDLLLEADILLSRVCVSQESVFAIADARRLLKAAYDIVKKDASLTSQRKGEIPDGG